MTRWPTLPPSMKVKETFLAPRHCPFLMVDMDLPHSPKVSQGLPSALV